MSGQYDRTELLLGAGALRILRQSRVAVFGLGGVGGYVVEALARSGIGTLDLVDNDRISVSNLNRQLLATHRTVGRFKTDAALERVRDIDPSITVHARSVFFGPDTAGEFDFSAFDYVVDAIDTVTGKLQLICQARDAGVPIISCMGTGNKLDPMAFRVDDLSRTSVCPLARIMRKELKRRGIFHLPVVYSTEPPREPDALAAEVLRSELETSGKRQIPASCAFVPPAAGLLLASAVVKDLLKL